MRELREKFEAAEERPGERKAAGDAIRAAWNVLMEVGFPDFDAIRLLRAEEWPHAIEQNQHALVALALEIVGWYQLGLRPYDIDRTARIFDRCVELCPHNLRALERFALTANTIQPQHIGGLAKFPKKQRETALGYRLQCKTKIDGILNDVFGITEAHLVGQASESITTLTAACTEEQRSFVFNILGHLARINKEVGDFFGNGTQLSLGIGAACCQLEILGLPREIAQTLTLLHGAGLTTPDQSASANGNLWAQHSATIAEILSTVASLCESKWKIFKNHSAQRRAQEIREFLGKRSSTTTKKEK